MNFDNKRRILTHYLSISQIFVGMAVILLITVTGGDSENVPNRKEAGLRAHLKQHWCKFCMVANKSESERLGCVGLERVLKLHHSVDTSLLSSQDCMRKKSRSTTGSSFSSEIDKNSLAYPVEASTISSLTTSTTTRKIKKVSPKTTPKTDSAYFLIMEWCLFCTTDGGRPACTRLKNKLLKLHNYFTSNIFPSDCKQLGAALPEKLHSSSTPAANIPPVFAKIPEVSKFLVTDWCEGCMQGNDEHWCDQITSDFKIYYEINTTRITHEECAGFSASLLVTTKMVNGKSSGPQLTETPSSIWVVFVSLLLFQ